MVFWRFFYFIHIISVTPLAYYYIINGVVYQSPDLYTFVQSRMLAVVDPLKKAFDEVMSLSRFVL